MNSEYEIFPIDRDVELSLDGPMVRLPRVHEDLVDDIWEKENRRRGGRLYDAPLLILTSHDRRRVRGHFIPYKDYLALRQRPELSTKTACPLGVSGLIESEGRLFFARRADHVTAYAGKLELIPSGGIDDNFLDPHGRIDFRKQLLRELKEETGITEEQASGLRPFALVLDKREMVWDLCVDIRLDMPWEAILETIRGAEQNEYRDHCCVPLTRLKEFLVTHNEQMIPTTLAMLKAHLASREPENAGGKDRR